MERAPVGTLRAGVLVCGYITQQYTSFYVVTHVPRTRWRWSIHRYRVRLERHCCRHRWSMESVLMGATTSVLFSSLVTSIVVVIVVVLPPAWVFLQSCWQSHHMNLLRLPGHYPHYYQWSLSWWLLLLVWLLYHEVSSMTMTMISRQDPHILIDTIATLCTFILINRPEFSLLGQR